MKRLLKGGRVVDPVNGIDGVIDIDHDKWSNPSTTDLSSNTDIWGLMLNLSYDLGWGKIRSITAYRELDWNVAVDLDNSPLTLLQGNFSTQQHQFSEELQLQYDHGPVSAILGGYYFDEDTFERATVPLSFPPSPPVITSILAGGPATRDLQLSNLETRSLAAFGEVSYEVVDGLELTGGLRYTEDRKTFQGTVLTASTSARRRRKPATPRR